MIDYKKFNLQEFVNWVAQQPPTTAYNGSNLNCCALAQFGYPGVASDEAFQMGLDHDLYILIISPRINGEAVPTPSTFGVLSNALREAGYEPQL